MSKNKLAAAKHKLALERNAQALRCLMMRKQYPRPTLKEIGAIEGVSGEWVRQVLKRFNEAIADQIAVDRAKSRIPTLGKARKIKL